MEVLLISPLFKHGHNYTLTVPREKVYDPETGSYSDPPGDAVTFSVQLELSSQQTGTEKPGLETNTLRLEGQVVKTPDNDPLIFPGGVKAGDIFNLTLFGKAGKMTLLPTPDEQHPKVRAKLGQEFKAVFEAVG